MTPICIRRRYNISIFVKTTDLLFWRSWIWRVLRRISQKSSRERRRRPRCARHRVPTTEINHARVGSARTDNDRTDGLHRHRHLKLPHRVTIVGASGTGPGRYRPQRWPAAALATVSAAAVWWWTVLAADTWTAGFVGHDDSAADGLKGQRRWRADHPLPAPEPVWTFSLRAQAIP